MSQPTLGPRLQRLRQILASEPRSSTVDTVEAVVGVLILEKQGMGLETLLIQRPENPNDPWSGQVGFPGGKVKASDPSLNEALRREVIEEVGIDLSQDGELVGTLSTGRPGRNPTVHVQPWVYALKRLPPMTGSDEVEEVFWASISDLPAMLTKAEVEVRGHKLTVACYLVNGHIVWGFTFGVLVELMQLLKITAGS